MVQVHYGEGVANHTDPESCAAYREVCGEALTGERAGQPLSHEIFLIQDADVVTYTEGKTDGCDIASARSVLRGRRPWHARTLLAWGPGDLQFDDLERSDPPIVAAKLANKSVGSDTESGEPRGGAKGNTPEPRTHRTLSRDS